jgi:uncharacterized coiled-coil protein SlyX
MAYVSARLTELELKYMRLERTVEELSGVVAEQHKTIEALLRELRTLETLSAREAGPPVAGDKPPHY